PAERITAQRPKTNLPHLRLLPRLQRQTIVIDHDHHAFAPDDRPFFCEVERHDWDVFEIDVLPDIQLCPVRQRKDTDALALMNLGVENVPQFGSLILWVPAVELVAEREDALLGT